LKWLWPDETALKDFPRQQVRDFLKHYEQALLLAEEASRRERCDWEMPPLTVQTMNRLPLEDVQGFRELANLLLLKSRLELAEGDFEKTLATLQVGLTLAQHVGKGETLIQGLVAMAIATTMLGRVEEMIQVPGCPNLYWALTALPSPLIDIRHPLCNELNTINRSFPQLRHLLRKPLSVEEVNQLADDFIRGLGPMGGPLADWSNRLGLAGLTLKHYPDARQHLLDRGRNREEVEAMPTLQVVLIDLVEQYDEVKDDFLKWLNLPSWQLWQEVQRQHRALTEKARRDNPLLALMLPLTKIVEVQLRLQLQIAGLRGAEALRLYGARHKGQPPEKWTDITEVPLPINPFTGQGLDLNYQFHAGKGVLEVLPPRNIPQLGRRYEWTKQENK
jgi:hypothetical protein